MAGNRFATMLHRHTHKITVILVYAILEWILIGLLLLNSLFSYLIMRFANYFGLKPPCVLCCRVDHLFEPEKSKKTSSYTDLLCEHHSTEISKLGYCSNHRKLAESHHMCDDCSSSRPNSNSNSIDISGRIGFFTWVKKMGLISSSGNCDENGEKFLSKCSCCDVSISRELCSPYLLLKPSSWGGGGVVDYTQKGNLITDDVYGGESSDPCKSDCQTDRFDEDEREHEEEEDEEQGNEDDDVEEKNYLRSSPSSSRCGDIEMAEDDVVSTSTSKRTEEQEVVEEEEEEVVDQFSDFKCIDDASIDILPMRSENCFDERSRFVPVELIDSMTLKKTQDLSGFEEMKEGNLDFESENEKTGHDLHVENLIDFSDDDDGENLDCLMVESMELANTEVFPVLMNNGELVVGDCIDEATQTPLCDVEEVLVVLNDSDNNSGNLIVFGDEPESGSFVEREIFAQEEPIAALASTQLTEKIQAEEPISSLASTQSVEEPQAEEPISPLASTQSAEELQVEEPIAALASTQLTEEIQAEEPISALASTHSVEEIQAEEPISSLASTQLTEEIQAEEPISALASTHSVEELQAEEPISALAVTYSTEELQAEEPISALSNQQEDSSSTKDDCDEHDMSSDVLMAEPENYEGANQAEEVKTLSVELNRQLSIIPEYNEVEEEKLPGTPTYEENLHQLTRRLLLEKKESGGEESLDGSVVSEIESGEGSLTVEKLKTALKAEHKALSALYAELEEERSSSAISANQTMAMITRLQEEKAAMQMEALQYQRMMEEQAEYDQEALQLLNELMVKREREKQELEKELEIYRKRVLHYEVKEKRMMMRRKVTSSGKSGASSVSSSNAADSEELSIDLNHEGPEEDSFYSHQDTPSDAVFNVEDVGLENSKQLSTLDESLADFEEERQSILEQLKALEEKLFTLGDNEEDEEELYEDIKPIEHFSEISYEFNVQETNGVHGNGFSDDNTGKPNYKAKRLLPLFDATDMENEDEEMNEEHDGYSNAFVSRNSSVSKFSPDEKKLAIEEEVDHVYERLQALEADREFLKHCISSLKKGDKGMELLQEILQHLRDLRNVELRVKSLGDTSSVQ